jgi:hypothetical protein
VNGQIEMAKKPGFLLVAVCDPALGEIVRGEFHCDAISGENTDSIPAEFAGEVG